MQRTKGALVSTAVKSLVPKGCARYLVGYRDSATEWMVGYGTDGVYHIQPSSGWWQVGLSTFWHRCQEVEIGDDTYEW